MDLVTMWNRVKYFITNCSNSCMSGLLSATQFGMSLWHYSFRSYKMCYSTLLHIWTFVTPWPPWRRRSPAEIALNGATDLLSKIWQHIKTVSKLSLLYLSTLFCCVFNGKFLHSQKVLRMKFAPFATFSMSGWGLLHIRFLKRYHVWSVM